MCKSYGWSASLPIALACLAAGALMAGRASAQGQPAPAPKQPAPQQPALQQPFQIQESTAPPYRASLGAQTASLSVDWVTPESILVGKEGLFELVVRNRGRAAVEQVTIRNALPDGFRLVKADPAPQQGGKEPVWVIKRLEAQEEARISLRLIPEKVGTAQSHARVDFRTSSGTNFRVVEPKLELRVEAAKEVLVGGQAVFHLTVKNPGTGKVTGAVVKAVLPRGLLPTSGETTFKLGDLNPGESRSIRVVASVTQLGRHACRFIATADSDLRDDASGELTALGADLSLAIDGPSFRYISRPASYTVRVKNTGTAAAQNVHLRCRVPKAFAYIDATNSGRFDSRSKSIDWFVGNLEIGQEFTGRFTLRADDRGRFPILAEAVAERGIRAEASHETKVEGIAAILLEVVDVDDPVEVGAETFYEVLVTNQGTDFARNVRITAKAPAGMTIVGSKGPSEGKIDGQTIRFDAIEKLAPRADAIYRVKVRSSKPGDYRIEVSADIETLDAPVTELESTKVYQDDVILKAAMPE